MYSAWMPSRCAVAEASSALVSSWNSASMTVRMATAPITITSAIPRSRARRFARLRRPGAAGIAASTPAASSLLRRASSERSGPRTHCGIPNFKGC